MSYENLYISDLAYPSDVEDPLDILTVQEYADYLIGYFGSKENAINSVLNSILKDNLPKHMPINYVKEVIQTLADDGSGLAPMLGLSFIEDRK